MTRHAKHMREANGAAHWRIWFANLDEAQQVAGLARAHAATAEVAKRVCLQAAAQHGFRWWPDERVRRQAANAVDRIEELIRRYGRVKTATRSESPRRF